MSDKNLMDHMHAMEDRQIARDTLNQLKDLNKNLAEMRDALEALGSIVQRNSDSVTAHTNELVRRS